MRAARINYSGNCGRITRDMNTTCRAKMQSLNGRFCHETRRSFAARARAFQKWRGDFIKSFEIAIERNKSSWIGNVAAAEDGGAPAWPHSDLCCKSLIHWVPAIKWAKFEGMEIWRCPPSRIEWR